jgi:hypothetical protein
MTRDGGRLAPAVSQCGYHLSPKFETTGSDSRISAVVSLCRGARTTLELCCQSLSTADTAVAQLESPKKVTSVEQSLMRLSISLKMS